MTSPTSLHRTVQDSQRSAFSRYQELAVGRKGILPLLSFEILLGLLDDMPGALGYLLRGRLYGWLFAALGRGATIGRRVAIRNPNRIRIGAGSMVADDVVLDGYVPPGREGGIILGDNVLLGRGTMLATKGGTIRIGDGTNIGAGCIVYARDTTVSIGSGILVAANGYIMGGGVHGFSRIDIPIMEQHEEPRGVVIGDGCWLGAGVKVADGVTIGEESVIGAGSLVTRDIPPFAVAYGLPAKVARSRKDPEE